MLSRTASKKDKMFGQQRKLDVEKMLKKNKRTKKPEPEPKVDLEYIKDYFKNEGKKLSKRGPPKSIDKKNFNSDEVDSMEKRVQKKLSKINPYVEISINDKGYDGDSSESSLNFQGFAKRRTKKKISKKSKKRSKKSKKRSKKSKKKIKKIIL